MVSVFDNSVKLWSNFAQSRRWILLEFARDSLKNERHLDSPSPSLLFSHASKKVDSSNIIRLDNSFDSIAGGGSNAPRPSPGNAHVAALQRRGSYTWGREDDLRDINGSSTRGQGERGQESRGSGAVEAPLRDAVWGGEGSGTPTHPPTHTKPRTHTTPVLVAAFPRQARKGREIGAQTLPY